MTQEEKAQRYDEALERAKSVIEQNPLMEYLKKGIEYIFPEFKESEDEKIRNRLISYFKSKMEARRDDSQEVLCTYSKWIAWLEKQGEPKLVISDDAIREGIAHFGITQYQIDNWLKKYVDVENQCEQKPQGESALEAIKEEKVDNQNCVKSADNIESSAFKDKMLELFQRFRWYCKDKTPTNGDIIDYVNAHMQELIDTTQKLADNQEWSDKDINFLTDIEYLLRVVKIENRSDNEYQRAENCLTWLKSLRPQKQWKPSKEQMDALDDVISSRDIKYDVLSELWKDLKKLKEE